jgi:hypothetical protein
MTVAEYIAELERKIEWHRELSATVLQMPEIESDVAVHASMAHDTAVEAFMEALALAKQVEQ